MRRIRERILQTILILFVACFLSSEASTARTLSINSMSEGELDAFIIEAVTALNEGAFDLASSIQINRNGRNDFEVQRAGNEIRERIADAPTLWEPGEQVFIDFTTVGQLKRYDFEKQVYFVCIPNRITVPGFTSTAFPRIYFNFSPEHSTSNETEWYGASCNVDRTIEQAALQNVPGRLKGADFALVKFRMDPAQAEALFKQSQGERVGLNVRCLVTAAGVGRASGWIAPSSVGCWVSDGKMSAGNVEVPIVPLLSQQGAQPGTHYMNPGKWLVFDIQNGKCIYWSQVGGDGKGQGVRWSYMPDDVRATYRVGVTVDLAMDLEIVYLSTGETRGSFTCTG